MGLQVQTKTISHARNLIGQGKVDRDSSWSIDSTAENKMLGDPPDWDEYALWFLVKDASANPETKEAYKYPIGKAGQIYRSALIAVRQRAGQQGLDAVFEAAGKLLDLIDKGQEAEESQMKAENNLQVYMAAAAAAPEEFLIFPLGQVTGLGMEPFWVTEKSITSVRANHQATGNDVVIDYEHQTLKGGIAPAAGWVKEFFQRNNGLACRVDWTDQAKEFIKNRQYRYFSPVVGLDKNRHLMAIPNMALTNWPKGFNLTPLVMKAASDTSYIYMEEKNMLKKILTLLGLPDGTSEEKALEVMSARLKQPGFSQEITSALSLKPEANQTEVLEAIVGLKNTVTVACQEIMSELGLNSAASKSETLATLRAMKQTQAAGISVAEFRAMQEKLANREADELVIEAMKAGKITAAQKDWAATYAKTDPAGFKLFMEKAPVVVVMKRLDNENPVPPAGTEITDIDRRVMLQMGVTEEEFKKYYRSPAFA